MLLFLFLQPRRCYSSSPSRKLTVNGPCRPEYVLPGNDSDISCICDEAFNQKIDDIVLQWLHCIPVLAVCSFSDRCMKVKSINCLKANLKVLIANDDVEAAKDEILKRLDSLPLWYPYDPDTFKAELAEDLLSKLKNIKKMTRASLAEWLRNVPLWYSDEERENFGNNLEISYEELKAAGLSEIEIKNRMKKFISRIIDDLLEKQGKIMELSEKNRLVTDIWEKLLDIIGDDENENVVNTYVKKIAEWMKDVPMFIAKTSGQKRQNENFAKTLAAKLAKLSALPPKERNKRIENDIVSSLDNFLEERGDDVPSDAKKEIIAKLLQSINDDSSRADITGTIQEEMLKTLEEAGLVPSTSSENIEFNRIIKNTAKQMSDFKNQGNSAEEIEELLRDNYKDAVEAILDCKNESLNPKMKMQLAESLMERSLKAASGINKVSEGDNGVNDPIKKYTENDILNFIDSIPEAAGMSSMDKKNVSAKIAEKIAQLTEEGYTNEDIAKRVQSELKDTLEDIGLELNPETVKNLAHSISEARNPSADTKVPRQNSRESKESLSKFEDDVISNIQQDLVKAFENIPELASTTKLEKNKVENICVSLAKKGQMLITKKLCDDEVKEKLKKDMVDAVDEILKATPKKTLNPINKTKAVDQLLDQLVTSANKTKSRKKSNGKLSNSSIKSFQNIPELTNATSAEKEELNQLSQKLTKKAEEMRAENYYTDEEIKEKLNDEFGDELNDMLQSIDPETKDTVVSQLLDNAVQSSSRYSTAGTGKL